MNNFEKRIKKLEKLIVSDPPNFKETSLHINNEAELYLHSVAKEILNRYHLELIKRTEKSCLEKKGDNSGKIDFTDKEQIIIDRSISLYVQRILNLFDLAIAAPIHLNKPFRKLLFYTRLNWFLKEISQMINLLELEDQIMSETDFFSLCPGERKEKLKPVYDQWRIWFSEESWEKFWKASGPKFRNFEE